MNSSIISEFFPVIPEMFLAVMAMFLLIAGVIRGDKYAAFINKAAVLVLLMAAILLSQLWGGEYSALNDMFKTNGYIVFTKMLVVFSAAAVLLMTIGHSYTSVGRFEHPVLVIFAVIGMMVMISSNDLISMYMGLELQSLSLYVLASIDRDSNKSSEAGLKYFVLGALASGFLLYGCSLVYGFTGTTSFDSLASIYQSEGETERLAGLVVGMIFVIIGFCFKVSAVPFHMWTPDVYEGSPTPVTAFFAAAPKIAAMALFVRVLMQPFGSLAIDWQQVIIFVSIVSMVVGALGALKQTNIKRLLAYSSIGHVGYLLVGLAAGAVDGVQSILIYLAIYSTMTIGVFACVIRMKRRGEPLEKISDFAGMAKTYPLFALVIAIFMFSMAGIPPLSGFFGKFFVFRAALGSGLYTLAIIGVLSSVIAAFYYLRIVKLMYFDESEDEMDEELLPELKFILLLTGVFNFFFFIFPTYLFDISKMAAATLFL